MDYAALYQKKLTSAAEAVKVVKSGDWVDYGWCTNHPYTLDKALAARQNELKDVKVRGGVTMWMPEICKAEDAGEHFTWNSWHCSGIDRKIISKGMGYFIPMRYSELPRFYRDGNATVDVAMIQVTPMDKHGNFSFAPLPAYQGKDLSEKNLTPELAKELAGMVKASSAIKPASFKSGVVTFDNLELGLYLIVQTKSISGYEKVAPFLVSVPLWDKDHYLYEINVSEKFEIKKEPPTPGTPETPDQPGDKLPQTGQVNWPMPVLLILGVALIVTGTALKRKSKHAR